MSTVQQTYQEWKASMQGREPPYKNVPRRCCVDLLSPAEQAIRAAVLITEDMPGSPEQTAVVITLQKARDMVADIVDGVPPKIDSATDQRVANNTVRHQYRVLDEAEKGHMVAIKDMGEGFLSLLTAIEKKTPGTPYGREFALARTKIEEAVMWAVKGITK